MTKLFFTAKLRNAAKKWPSTKSVIIDGFTDKELWVNYVLDTDLKY